MYQGDIEAIKYNMDTRKFDLNQDFFLDGDIQATSHSSKEKLGQIHQLAIRNIHWRRHHTCMNLIE